MERCVLQPVIPFEPIRTDTFPEGTQWVAQVKWDGVRILAYLDNGRSALYNRRLHERTQQYPELADVASYARAQSVILDGEVIALCDGRPSFYQVMRRDGVRRLDRIPSLVREVPVHYMVFDILYCNGRWLLDEPLRVRQQVLAEVLAPHPFVLSVDNETDARALFQAVCEQQMEGIVLKDLSSRYVIGGKDGRWRKKKWYRDKVAVIGGCTLRRADRVNSVLLGLYDEAGRLWYIGHAGTGRLPEEGWSALTREILASQRGTSPFVNLAKAPEAIWVEPKVAVRVAYAEWVQGHTLRQASIQARVAMSPNQCRLAADDPEPV
jgi:bifunctional non-homologous end joining protein LigD